MNNHIIGTKCPIDMTQTALENFVSFYCMPKTNFGLCPVQPGVARMPHIFKMTFYVL